MMDGHAGKYAAQVILHTNLCYNEKPTAEGKKQQCFLPKSYGTLNFQQLDTKIFCLMLLKQVIALGATRRYAPPPADGSSKRDRSTSVSGWVRSPHIPSGKPAVGSQCVDSLGS